MKVIVTGSCGYKGSVLVNKLLQLGHEVIGIDAMWFGCNLSEHPNLTIIREDIRDIKVLPPAEILIHLAAVANDPSCDLDPKLTWEVNVLGTLNLLTLCKKHGIKRFIYASSGSVYGLSEELEVHEELPLVPLSEYNKTKMVAERVVQSFNGDLLTTILRPATVCGVSPRQRYDVAVNALTISALEKQVINVNGGNQMRPNVHIYDIVDAYIFCLSNPNTYGEIFNVGFEDMTLSEIAVSVLSHIPCQVNYVESNDPRSYRLSAKKFLSLGFVPRHSVDDGIQDIVALGVPSSDVNYNVKWMSACNIK